MKQIKIASSAEDRKRQTVGGEITNKWGQQHWIVARAYCSLQNEIEICRLLNELKLCNFRNGKCVDL